jgi:hypothetical protein
MMIGNQFRLTPVELTEARQIQLSHVYPGLRYLASAKQLSVSAPKDAQGEILEDRELIDWAWVFLAQVFPSPESAQSSQP